MEEGRSQTKFALEALHHLRVRLFFSSIVVGILTGLTVSLFRLGITTIAKPIQQLIEAGHENWLFAAGALVLFAVLGFASSLLSRAEPYISGSGIPQISAELTGRIHTKWYRVLPLKLIGGFLSLGSGLTVGREGPSVQIGGSIGKGVACTMRRPVGEQNYLMTGGAAAGLATAFNAPIAGVVFALEELHRNFSPRVLLCAMTAAFSADFISANIFGMQPVLSFLEVPMVPLEMYWLLLLVGALAGLSGILFNRGILFFKHLYAKLQHRHALWRGVIPFVLTCALLLIDPTLFGSGEEFIFLPVAGSTDLLHLLTLYALKFLLVWVAFGSGIAGGIFFPLLVLGSLLGNMTTQALQGVGLVDQNLVLTFSLLAMAAHFSSIVRSPLTGILLIAEMTASFSFMLPLGIVCLVAYTTAEIMRSTPIYESLQELVPGLDRKDDSLAPRSEHIVREFVLEEDSSAAYRKINQVAWPKGMIIVSVMRGSEELSPLPDRLLLPGDYLMVLSSVANFQDHTKELLQLIHNPGA